MIPNRQIGLAILLGMTPLATPTLRAAPYTWTGAVSSNWFGNGNWSAAGFPGVGDTASLPSGTPRAVWLTNATAALASLDLAAGQVLTVNGTGSVIQADTITISGTITHPTNNVFTTNALGEWVPLHRVWLAGSNITIAAGGSINVSYMGYPLNAGPGRPPTAYCGAGHAGEGGAGASGAPPGQPYDDPAAPEQPGSGAWNNSYSGGGGGAIRIDATGQLTLEGSLLADGRTASSTHGGGGSGGSIRLTCRTLHGSAGGLASVNGGSGNYYGGGGSGGRIAVSYNTNAQAALPEPRPAIRFHGKPGDYTSQSLERYLPDMGSLRLPDTLLITGALDGQRFWNVRLAIPGFTNWSADSLTLDDCILGLPEGLALTVTNDLTLTNSAALHLFAAPVSDLLTEVGARVDVGGNLNLGPGCWIMPYAHPTNGATVRFTVGGDLDVEDTAGFDADRRGYTRGFGYGALVAHVYGAGAHGGRSSTSHDGTPCAEPRGDPEFPILPGSAGSSTGVGGRGGGCIRLNVTGQARIHGTLTARGSIGIATHGGAGAGGGILLECDTLVAGTNAALRADGGLGNYYGASAGGGRIAIHYNPAAQAALPEPCPPVRCSAYAYPYSSQGAFRIRAHMGTLWLPDTLFLAHPIDRFRLWYVNLVVGSGLDAWAPAELTISNAVFELPEGYSLSVTGDLTLAAGDALPAGMLGSSAEGGLHLRAAATNALYGARLRVDGNLTLADGGWLHLYTTGSNAAIVGIRVASNLTVAGGGGMNADERGFDSMAGNLNGPGAGNDIYNAGGGYGGRGGGVAGGSAYGTAILPLAPGSPGGWSARGGFGVSGAGGGAIHVLAGGALILDGTLTARGQNGVYYRGSAGSGGSIFLSGMTLAGTGTLYAAGGIQGDTGANDACGGGGRIAVWYNIPLYLAEARVAAFRTEGFTNRLPLATFPATLNVDAGWSSPSAAPGTAGVYDFALMGTVLAVY